MSAPLKTLYQQPRSLTLTFPSGKTNKTSMIRGHISMPNFVIFVSKVILVSHLGILKECIPDSSETDYAPIMTKNATCTLNVIRKINLNSLVFVRINIYSIRNNFDMPASEVEGNADMVMISTRWTLSL